MTSSSRNVFACIINFFSVYIIVARFSALQVSFLLESLMVLDKTVRVLGLCSLKLQWFNSFVCLKDKDPSLEANSDKG